MHKARAKGTNLETKLDGSSTPGTFTRTDDYTLEIHFKGEETAASIPQEEFLAAGTKTKKEYEQIETTIRNNKGTFDKAKTVVNDKSKALVSDAQIDEIIKTIGKPEYDDILKSMKTDKFTEEEAAVMVDLIRNDFSVQQHNKFFRVSQKSPLEEAGSVVNIEGVSSTVKLQPVDEIEEFMALSEKVADGRATTAEVAKLKEVERNVQVYGDQMGEYQQLKKALNPTDAQVKRLNQLENMIAQRELERIDEIKNSFEEALKIANQGTEKTIDEGDINLIMLQIKDTEGVDPSKFEDRVEAVIELKKLKEVHLIHEIEKIHTLGIMENNLMKNFVKSSYNKFSRSSAISSAESIEVLEQEQLARNIEQAATSS